MSDPSRGFRIGRVYRAPAHAVMEHPSLFLVVTAIGLGATLVAPDRCVAAFSERRCIVDVAGLGALLAVGSLLPYVYVRFRQDAADR